MYILSKIKHTLIFTILSTIINSFVFSGDYEFTEEKYEDFKGKNCWVSKNNIMPDCVDLSEEMDNTSPKSIYFCQYTEIVSDGLPNIDLDKYDNGYHYEESKEHITPLSVALRKSPYLPQTKIQESEPISHDYQLLDISRYKSVDLISIKERDPPLATSTIKSVDINLSTEELSISLVFTINLRSNHTKTVYKLRDAIGKPIKEYIRALKIKNILNEIDRQNYNFGSPVSYYLPLPQSILDSLGISTITENTIVTKDVAEQLNEYSCIFEFSFEKQTVLSSNHERATYPIYQKERNPRVYVKFMEVRQSEKYIREQMTTDFTKSTRETKISQQAAKNMIQSDFFKNTRK
ncbi:MAG: hypothetical protein V4544_03825 [Pseudomonadota bacterium]